MKQGGLSFLMHIRDKTNKLSPTWGDDVPFIMITGAPMQQEFSLLSQAFKLGATQTLQKPFEPEILLEKILDLV